MNTLYICHFCGKEFKSKKRRKNRIPKFCTHECYGKSMEGKKIPSNQLEKRGQRKGLPIKHRQEFIDKINNQPPLKRMKAFICQYCGRVFHNNKWSKNRIPKFCNHQCSGASKIGKKLSFEHIRKSAEARKGHTFNRGKKRNEEFKRNLSERMKGNSYTLGKKLSDNHRTKISQGNKGKIISEEHRKKMSRAMKGRKQSIEQRLKISGPNHPQWKGGITSEYKRIRDSIEYAEWRNAVFKRDDYTCQICQNRGGKLHADHIMPFAIFIELRFDIKNGRTLCEKCHRKTDTYGIQTHKMKQYSQSNIPIKI